MRGNHPFDLFKGGGFSRRSIIDPESGQPIESMLNRAWLQSLAKDELVDFVLELAQELKVDRREQSTVDMPVSLEPQSRGTLLSRGPAAPQVMEFLRLPLDSERPVAEAESMTWRLVLTRLDGQLDPLGVEVWDDVIVGRTVQGMAPHLDLTFQGAEDLGVSRLHALIRPTQTSLLLFDLDSSNGTFRNRQRCIDNTPLDIQDGDVIRFGALAFRVSIVGRPPGSGAQSDFRASRK